MKSPNILRNSRNTLVPIAAAALTLAACSGNSSRKTAYVPATRSELIRGYGCLKGTDLDPATAMVRYDTGILTTSTGAAIKMESEIRIQSDRHTLTLNASTPPRHQQFNPADTSTLNLLEQHGCEPSEIHAFGAPRLNLITIICGIKPVSAGYPSMPDVIQICRPSS